MKPISLFAALVFLISAANCLAQESQEVISFPVVTDEAAIAEVKNALSAQPKISKEAKTIINHPMVELSILADLLRQHASCFKATLARAQNKPALLDHELTDTQEQKIRVIYSEEYRKDVIRNPLFTFVKELIVGEIAEVDEKVTVKAIELLNDEVGQVFFHAWFQPIRKGYIDRSCGTNPYEAVLERWQFQMLWEMQAIKYKLNGP